MLSPRQGWGCLAPGYLLSRLVVIMVMPPPRPDANSSPSPPGSLKRRLGGIILLVFPSDGCTFAGCAVFCITPSLQSELPKGWTSCGAWRRSGSHYSGAIFPFCFFLFSLALINMLKAFWFRHRVYKYICIFGIFLRCKGRDRSRKTAKTVS